MVELEGNVLLSLDQLLQPDRMEEDQALVARISSAIHWHVAPIIMLAHSRTNLAAKTRVFLHTLALLCSSRESLIELCKSIVSIHTDYGTEVGISRVSECPLETFLPYIHSSDQQPKPDHEMFAEELAACDMDLFMDDDELEPDFPGGDGVVSFDSVFEGPDMMHIIHNATNYLEDVVDCYAPTIAALKSICSLLSGRESKQQLIEMCFQSGPAIAYHDEIRKFTITVHEKRWNTIASAIEEVNKLEPALKSHWNLAQFLGKEKSNTDDFTDNGVPTARPGETESSPEYGVNLRVVDDALSSDFFWGSLKVLLQVAVVQRQAVRFVNGCVCHSDMLHADDKTAEKLSETCPLRGRRCAELASGEFFDLVQSLFQARATTLELQLPRGLADDEVMQLMKDFEVARQHLVSTVSTYVLKLGFWTQAPHVLAGLAHWDPRVRAHCLRKCLNSDSSHPKIQFIRNNMAAVHAFLASGGAWFESEVLDPLRVIACEMRLMFTSAWRVEGQHARTKKASQHAPHHSAAYTSLSHRLPEIRAHLRACPESASQLADLMGRVSNGRAAAQQLGFRDDLLMKCGWINPKTFVKKKVGFSVIYHDDPHCKYTLELPERVQQTYIKRRELTLSTDAIPDGSVEVRRVLALHDVRKTASAKMFFSMKFNRNTMHSVISLLSPGRDNLPALPAFAAEGEFDSLEWEPGCPLATTKEDLSAMGLVVPVADLLDGGGDALSQEFVIGSVLHLQPSRFRRTHVEEEASLSGMWLVQLHSILDLNSRKKELIVSLEAANLGEGGTCVTAPLALHVSQLSLSELQCLFMWQTDDSKIVHRFDNQFMSTLPVDMKVHVLETARYLLKSPDGLALTTDMGQGNS